MALFESFSVVLDLKRLPFKEQKKLKLSITENGGSISHVVNKQCTFIVASSLSSLSSSRLRSLKKYNTPLVGVDYVYDCLQKRVILPVEKYNMFLPLSLTTPGPPSNFQQDSRFTEKPLKILNQTLNAFNPSMREENPENTRIYLGKFRIYTENDPDIPMYPPNFQVAKYSIFEKANIFTISVLELQSCRGKEGWQYRVVLYWTDNFRSKSSTVSYQMVFCTTSEESIEIYQIIMKEQWTKGLQQRSSLPPGCRELGSASLQQLLLEKNRNYKALSQEVGVFVELLWTEALGCLDKILKIPINRISLNDVSRAEGLLLHVQRRLKEEETENEVVSLMEEVYTILPHRQPCPPVNIGLISQKLDLCQLIRDVLNATEVSMGNLTSSSIGKYRALNCSIKRVPPGCPEFESVSGLLQDRKVQILQLFQVSRGVELQIFKEDLGNVKRLLHSTSPSSFVGILTRGLLLPRDGVEHHGIKRTDIGYLGSGIYFSNAMSTSVKYSKPSMADGSRLLLVCDVVLGCCLELKKKDTSLSHTPEGYHSLHGVRTTPERPSEFEDDEYVVYSPEQVKLKYVVQFSLEDDLVKGFQPSINTAIELELPSSTSDLLSVSEVDDIGSYNDPMDNVTAGLLDNTGKAIPLQAIHLKCKLMDLVSEVIIFQKYTNHNSQPIEAKYVFPLDDSAVVCGFEAFVNGKHLIGQVKEKEQARKDYSQAIKKGHGAYLMDQDAPDMFTISVGNLPPHATVLIKVTYVAELVVKSGFVIFLLPGRVAPWQQDAALNQTTQGTVEKVCVTELETQGEFTLDMSIEMPYEIIKLHCITHKVKIKRTDCKVVVRTLTGQSLGSDGFQLSFSLSQIHMPRMWVENHPDKDSQACMLVFYPDFDSTSNSDEIILLLDTSESMRGEPQQNARRLSLEILRRLDPNLKVNVIIFGEDQKEAFPAAQPLHNIFHQAKMFIMSTDPVGGNTDLWSPLHNLSLLPPSRGSRNILLLSDGHVQNQSPTLQLLREHVPHSRLFTCGLSSTANKHMLRALAQAGGGAYEFFDIKTKHTWMEKVTSQVKRMTSVGCSSVSVKWHQFNSTGPSVQAPTQLSALFNDCHTLVYGFVQHCTQATLLYDLRDEEIKTIVSTSELQKTKGTLLHKLTASAVIRDFENGSLHSKEAEHEEKKAELKSFIIELSKEFSILSHFTSFVAIEERDSEHVVDGFTDIPKLITDQDVDFLPYLTWIEGGEGGDKVEQSNTICREYMEKVHTEELFIAEDGFDEENEEMDTHNTLDCSPSHSEPFNMSRFSKATHKKCSRSNSFEETQGVLQERRGASRFARKAVACKNEKKPRGCHSVPQTSMIKKSMDRDTHLVDVESFPIDNSAMTLKSAPFSHPEHPSHSQNVLSDCPHYFPTLSSSHPAPPPPHLYLGSISPPKFAPFHSPDSSPSLPLSSMQTSHHVPDDMCALGDALPSTGFLESRKGAKKKRTVQKCPPRIPSKDGVILHSASSSMEQDQPPSSTHSFQPLMGYGSRSGATEAKPLIRTQFYSEFSSSHLSFCVTPQAPHPPLTVIGSAHTYLGPAKASTGFGAMMTPSEFSSVASTHACDGFKREWGAATITKPSLNFLFEEEHALVRSEGPDARLQISPPSIQHLSSMRKSIITTVKWPEVFDIQHSDGYWECSARLGALLNLDMDCIAIFLKDRGICSLGVRAHADILKLMASLLVLQLMRVQGLEEGKLLRTLFCLEKSPQPRTERWEAVRKAVDWVCWADKQYPCVCSRLEFGLDWESSTHRLLNVDPPVLFPHGTDGKGGCACSFCLSI